MISSRNKLLASAGFTGLTICYVYDLPGALNYTLNFTKDASATMISILYSAYAIPNTILPYLLCYIGVRFRCSVLFILAFTVLFGQLIFTLGVYFNRFSVMIVGRVVTGIGGESYSVIQNKIISERYKIHELGGAMTFYSACSKMGTLLTFLVTPAIAEAVGALIACIFSLALSLVGCISTYNFCLKYRQTERPVNPREYIVVPMLNENRPMRPRLPTGFRSPFRLIMGLHFIIGCAWSPFYNVAPMIFQTRFKMEPHMSSYAVSLVEAISLTVTAIISCLIGKIGNNLNFSVVGCSLLLLSHLNMILYENKALRSILLLGFASSLIYLYLPCLPKMVERDDLTLTFALLCCSTNVAFSVSPLFVAVLTVRDNTYLLVEMYIVFLAFIGLAMVLFLSYINVKYNVNLNRGSG